MDPRNFLILILGVPFLITTCAFMGPLQPMWKSWQGEAELARAISERKIQIEDAKGRLEASKMLALAEVERAKGVSEANKIIGESLKNNEAYLRYLYINNLEKAQEHGTEIIYVPTEASLPILEAGKRKN